MNLININEKTVIILSSITNDLIVIRIYGKNSGLGPLLDRMIIPKQSLSNFLLHTAYNIQAVYSSRYMNWKSKYEEIKEFLVNKNMIKHSVSQLDKLFT